VPTTTVSPVVMLNVQPAKPAAAIPGIRPCYPLGIEDTIALVGQKVFDIGQRFAGRRRNARWLGRALGFTEEQQQTESLQTFGLPEVLVVLGRPKKTG
jgi:hypothetical protein